MKAFTFFILFVSAILSVPAQVNEGEKGDDPLIKTVFFGGGSYYIDEEQRREIEKFILSIENIQQYEVVISGHTDNIGGKEYNEWLSQMRSLAVRKHLLEIQVPDDIISMKKFGQDNPLYDNRSWAGRRANRRVDIILLPITF